MIKAVLKEDSDGKKPKLGDKVKVSMKVTKEDAIVDEEKGFECTVGDDSLDLLKTTIDKELEACRDVKANAERRGLCGPVNLEDEDMPADQKKASEGVHAEEGAEVESREKAYHAGPGQQKQGSDE